MLLCCRVVVVSKLKNCQVHSSGNTINFLYKKIIYLLLLSKIAEFSAIWQQ